MMNENTKFGRWLTLATLSRFKLERYSRPRFVGKVEVPTTLNELTIGQIIELSELKDDNESLYKICEIVLGMERKAVRNARAVDVVRFIGWVYDEVERINKLFSKTDNKPTAREQRAGIERLRFGLFGLLDWYAVRMGITNPDDVLPVPWMRIYKCMQMDNEKRAYEIRLNKVAAEEMKHNRR